MRLKLHGYLAIQDFNCMIHTPACCDDRLYDRKSSKYQPVIIKRSCELPSTHKAWFQVIFCVVFFTYKLFKKVIDTSVLASYYRGSFEYKNYSGAKNKN